MQTVLKDIIEKHGAVVFNGDGYSEAWHQEAEKRGLPNLKTTVDALPVLGTPEVIALFEKYNVLSKRETLSRMDIYLEQYIKTVKVEAKLVIEMAKTMIFPAAVRYQGELALTCANLKAVGYTFDTDTLDKITALVKTLQDSTAALEKISEEHPHGSAGGGEALLPKSAARDGGSSQAGRRAGRNGGRRPLAAADVSRDVVHQVTESFNRIRLEAYGSFRSRSTLKRELQRELQGWSSRFSVPCRVCSNRTPSKPDRGGFPTGMPPRFSFSPDNRNLLARQVFKCCFRPSKTAPAAKRQVAVREALLTDLFAERCNNGIVRPFLE